MSGLNWRPSAIGRIPNRPKREPKIIDCRRMRSLSYEPYRETELSISAHEGTKPNVGDYLVIDTGDGKGLHLYRATHVNHCWNVDPANMWIAHAEHIPGRKIPRHLADRLEKEIL